MAAHAAGGVAATTPGLGISGTDWDAVLALVRRPMQEPRAPVAMDWYRIGDGCLGIRSDDLGFSERFRTLFGGCGVPGPDLPAQLQVTCTVRSLAEPAAVLATFDDPEPLDQVAFAEALFPERQPRPGPMLAGGWRRLCVEGAEFAVSDGMLLARQSDSWQLFVANMAINRLIRLQRRLGFFHAASLNIGGAGVLLMGPRGSGKTTHSMALAARGHGLLGDEMAAVRLDTLELLPVRRALSVRPGPRSAEVTHALRDWGPPSEIFPDGTPRLRVQIAHLFPDASAGPVSLKAVVFLRERAAAPRLQRCTPGVEHVRLLTPLGSTLWSAPPAGRAVEFMRLLSRVSCFVLEPGPPDATADLLEQLSEA